MLYMVIERFRKGDAKPVYRRLRDHGRVMPDGLTYAGSWVATNFGRCFQLMECDDVRLLQQWIEAWQDLVEFEVVAVLPSKEAAETIKATL